MYTLNVCGFALYRMVVLFVAVAVPTAALAFTLATAGTTAADVL